jgi:putative DNA primase/helicase
MAETFIDSKNKGIPVDLARLWGARLVRIPETEDGARFARQIVKRITGRDVVAARHLYGKPFEYEPDYKLWFITNHLPSVPHTDEATWSRIHLIPFNVYRPKNKRDKKLKDKMVRNELAGILAWAVQGARDWYREGLNEPSVVRVAVAQYRDKQDTLRGFINEHYHNSAKGMVLSTKMYATYEAWCQGEELTAMSRRAFGLALDEHGYSRYKDADGTRYRTGLEEAD